MGAIAVVPGLGFLAHPLRRDTTSGGDEPRPVAMGGAVKPGRPVRVHVLGDRQDAWVRLRNVKLGSCWLVRPREGSEVKAFSTICPHLGCGIDWNEKKGTFECPCHDSAFDLEGRCLGGPSPRGLDELDVVARGDEIKVRYRRFKIGTPDKEPIG
jgi:Rieske Fe-S protein